MKAAVVIAALMTVTAGSRAAVVIDASPACHDDAHAMACASGSGVAGFAPWQRGRTLTSAMALPYGYIATGAGDALVATGLMAGALLVPSGQIVTLVFNGFAVANTGLSSRAGVSAYVGDGGTIPAPGPRLRAGVSTVSVGWTVGLPVVGRDAPGVAVAATSPGYSVGLLRRSGRKPADASAGVLGTMGLAARYHPYLLMLDTATDRSKP